jgi:hypothetical protein
MVEAEMKQVLHGSMSTGTKEDESSIGRIWAAVFHHVTACSPLVRVLKPKTSYVINFQISFLRPR